MEITERPAMAQLPQHLLEVVLALIMLAQNFVWLVWQRSVFNLMKVFGKNFPDQW
jgi:hypothetical protein